jgi:hypothetical protein
MGALLSAPTIISSTTPTTLAAGTVIWTSGSTVNSSNGLMFDSTNFQLGVCNTYSNNSNYRRLSLTSTSTAATVKADSLGSGGANYSLRLEASGTGTVFVSKSSSTNGLVLTSENNGHVNPPYLVFGRSTGIGNYTTRVRLQGSLSSNYDFSAFVVTTNNASEFLIAGDGLLAEYAHGQCNRTTNNILSVMGNIYTRGNLVVGQDAVGGEAAGGGIIRSGQKDSNPVLAGYDLPGSSLTIQAGAGTGAAATGQILLQTPTVGASGTTQQTQATRLAIGTTSVDASVPIRLNRLTTTQINALASPQQGWIVFNTTLNLPCFYDGTAWQRITGSAM